MSVAASEWTLEGFVEHFDFVHHKMLDHKFVWVLGAGASFASGIPVGSHLVDRWLKEMHVKEAVTKLPLPQWATAEQLGISGFNFEDRAGFYPKVYHRRFLQYPEEGYAYLESVMSGKDPSPGYSILAAALATDPPRHNVVITTNFDNLVADALSIYTDTFPFVAGHESLTGFVRVSMRRPLICKIHRDLLLGPQSDPRSLRRLHDAWGTALRALFQHYTPLFIGYGGNDDTLMDLLESLQPGDTKGQLIWCYYEKSEPSARIRNMVGDLNGILVPVPDFDLLMVLLGEKMGISTLDEEIGQRAAERTQRYRDRIQRLDTVNHPSVAEALAATLDRSGGWWAWYQKTELETDPARRETVYRQGIQHCPESAGLLGNFANFMTDERGNHDEAEIIYRKSIELDPKNAINISNFATFLWQVRGNHEEAEGLYRKSVELDPKEASIIGMFAYFMSRIRGNHAEAEGLYQKSIELDPRNANIIGNFAIFMRIRGKHDEAERLYRKALEVDADDAANTGNFANFLWQVSGNRDEAERLYRKSLELDSQYVDGTGNYAGFLLAGGRLDEATICLEQAKSLNKGERNQLAAELALYGAILARVKRQDDTIAVEELKKILSGGYLKNDWSFDAVLAFVQEKLTPADHVFFSALAAAILDAKQVCDIDDLLQQRAATLKTSSFKGKNGRKTVSQSHQSNGHERGKPSRGRAAKQRG